VLVNAFVGAMVGLERSILPLIAEQEFHITSASAILSFLVTFGIVKALSNLLAGGLSERTGRKKLLVMGWLAGIPVPFLLMWGPSWNWIIAANILLGINQGLCWSTTVIMKTDLAGSRQRGLAMGLNEFSGYLAVAGAAYLSADLASQYGLRPYPFYLGIGCAVAGFLLSAFLVRETRGFSLAKTSPVSTGPGMRGVFWDTSWKNKNLASCCQAGLVNNLNDGMVWGVLPLFLSSLHFRLPEIGLVAGLYPLTWGVLQLPAGALSDRIGRKTLIAGGMFLQAVAIFVSVFTASVATEVLSAVLLGMGTAMVYPTLLAAVGDAAQPAGRAAALGVYRFWRDLGYAVGAVISGVVADTFGIGAAILAAGFLTLLSGLLFAVRYRTPELARPPASR